MLQIAPICNLARPKSCCRRHDNPLQRDAVCNASSSRSYPGRAADHQLQLRANHLDRVKQAFRLQTIACVSYSTLLWALAELAQWALRIYMGCVLLMGLQISCQQTFIAFGNSRISAFLAIFRKVLVLIPLIYLLPALLKDNVQAVFLTEPIADFIAVMTTAILFAVNFKKLMRQMRSQNSNAA